MKKLLNLERNAMFIFPPTTTQGLDKARTKRWVIKTEEGEIEASLKIVPSVEDKAYSERSKGVMIALIKIWEGQGRPVEKFTTSIREIGKHMEVPSNGHWNNIISDELNILYRTTMTWTTAYKTDGTLTKTVNNQQILDISDSMDRATRTREKAQFKSTVTVRFDEHTLENLLNRKTIPINWTTRKLISSSYTRVLFDRIDSILSKKSIVEMKAETIISDLQISNRSYVKKSKRKEFLENIQKQLDGLKLSTGKQLNVSIKETSDGTDWKCTFTCSQKEGQDHKHKPAFENHSKQERENLVQMMIMAIGHEEESRGLYEKFALHYTDTMIFRAISEFKEAKGDGIIRNEAPYFTMLMHVLAHKFNKLWIKPCEADCKYTEQSTQ